MKEVGSVLVEYHDRLRTKKLIEITEEKGNIYINRQRIPVSYNVEESIRWVLRVPSELYIIVTDFETTSPSLQFKKTKVLQSWWEDYASTNTIVTASFMISKMDYESGYDSV